MAIPPDLVDETAAGETAAAPTISRACIGFDDWMALQQLHADYAAALDAGQWERWPQFFIEQCVYRIQPRENHERGFPLATLSLTSRGMLEDRVYGIRETLFHDPYYQRHVVGAPSVHRIEGDRIFCEANYAVFRTKLSEPTTVFNVGRYIDVVVRTPEGLRFASRECIYDTELIPNAIIYPI
jgi:salicylate 5-hydroxylase small subunit